MSKNRNLANLISSSATPLEDLVANAPTALNTLNELATALGNDANFATTVTNALTGKQASLGYTPVNKVGDTMSGALIVQSGGATLETNDTNGYARLTHSNGSAQLGLFRTGSSSGGGYIGADGNNCLDVRTADFTTKLRVDQTGRLTMPNQPAFSVSKNNGGTATSPIIFNEEYANTGGYYSASTGRFTAPVSGRYFFSASLMMNGTNNYLLWAFFKNGSGALFNQYFQGYSYATSGDKMVSGSVVANLSVGDYVDIRLPSSYINYYTSGYNSFCGYLIG